MMVTLCCCFFGDGSFSLLSLARSLMYIYHNIFYFRVYSWINLFDFLDSVWFWLSESGGLTEEREERSRGFKGLVHHTHGLYLSLYISTMFLQIELGEKHDWQAPGPMS